MRLPALLLQGALLGLCLAVDQACSRHSNELPTPASNAPGSSVSIQEAHTWYQATHPASLPAAIPGQQLPPATSAGLVAAGVGPSPGPALVWDRAVTVGQAGHQLVLVPLAGDQALFAGNPWQGRRYLVVAKNANQALNGILIELLLRRTVTPVDTAALFSNLYHRYQSGHLAAPAQGDGFVLLYTADYQYLTGRQFHNGQLGIRTAQLAFQLHPSSASGALKTTASNQPKSSTDNTPTANFAAPIGTCVDWYDVTTGKYITTTGSCGSGGGEGDVPGPYTGGGGPAAGGSPGSGYGGYGHSGSTHQVGNTSDGIAADGPLSVGDYSKDCKVTFINGVTDIHVLVEATINQNPPKIEKLTLTATGGLADAVKPVGDGTGHYDAVNNAFIFTVYYQVNSSVVSSRLERVEGVLYLNTGRYVLRRFSN